MDVFGKVTAVIISVLLFFWWPLSYFYMKQDALADIYIMHETVKFVRETETEGKITEEQYNRYIEQLSHCGKLVHVKMEEEAGWITVRVSNGFVYGGTIANEND